MTATPVRESRRYDVPPLWSVPLLLIGAIFAIVYASLALSFVGLAIGVYAVWRLERWADAHVKQRNAARD
jgi:hypothetical protein